MSLTSPTHTASAETGADGRFSISGIERQRYLISLGEGYTAPQAVDLRAGQKVTGIELRAQRNPFVAGRLQDALGQPVDGAKVWLISPGDGYFPPLRRRSGISNALGDFLLSDVAPGRYLLLAEPSLPIRLEKPAEDVEPEPGGETDVPTYYPNSSTAEGAAAFEVFPNRTVEGVNIRVAQERTACVRSRVVDPASKTGAAIVSLTDAVHDLRKPLATYRVPTEEGFWFCGLPPGAYTFSVVNGSEYGAPVTGGEKGHRYASQAFTIGGRNVRLPDLVPQAPGSLAGRLTIDGDRERSPLRGTVSVTLQGRHICSAPQAFARLTEEGPFAISGVCPGEYWLTVRPPDGFYLKAATLAGADMRRAPAELSGGELSIVLGNDGPALTVQAMNSRGQPVAGVAVLVVPDPVPRTLGLNDLAAGLTEANGVSTFRRLAPGDYRVVAVSLASEAIQSQTTLTDAIRAYGSAGVRVSLAARETRTLQVKVVGAPE